ncbi:MAG: class II glutamine amidotransferase [Oscillospiraceae bacterium]|nr:class II glutamine amidotransferase [Oscillospiraceae bacterium]
MCALFGFLDYGHRIPIKVLQRLLQALANASEIRGNHAAGIAYLKDNSLTIYKRPKPAHKLHFKLPRGTSAVMGHTRFTTQGSEKQNYNNHPFKGHAGEVFALAHNGVLYNERELKQQNQLPPTVIETDSYVAVQLLEGEGKVDFESLKSMAETVCGSYTFTVLTEQNVLYFVKGTSPLYLIHFPKHGLYVYTSTSTIMHEALERMGMLFLPHEVVPVNDGDLIKLNPNGRIETASFAVNDFEISPKAFWSFANLQSKYRSLGASSFDDDELEELLDLCGYYGLTEDDVLYMREIGYSFDEIEEFLYCPSAYERALMEGEL